MTLMETAEDDDVLESIEPVSAVKQLCSQIGEVPGQVEQALRRPHLNCFLSPDQYRADIPLMGALRFMMRGMDGSPAEYTRELLLGAYKTLCDRFYNAFLPLIKNLQLPEGTKPSDEAVQNMERNIQTLGRVLPLACDVLEAQPSSPPVPADRQPSGRCAHRTATMVSILNRLQM